MFDIYIQYMGVDTAATMSCYRLLTALSRLPEATRSQCSVVDVAKVDRLRRPAFLCGVPLCHDTATGNVYKGREIVAFLQGLHERGPASPPEPDEQEAASPPQAAGPPAVMTLEEMISARRGRD